MAVPGILVSCAQSEARKLGVRSGPFACIAQEVAPRVFEALNIFVGGRVAETKLLACEGDSHAFFTKVSLAIVHARYAIRHSDPHFCEDRLTLARDFAKGIVSNGCCAFDTSGSHQRYLSPNSLKKDPAAAGFSFDQACGAREHDNLQTGRDG